MSSIIFINNKVGGAGLLEGSDEDCLQVIKKSTTILDTTNNHHVENNPLYPSLVECVRA